MRQARQMHTGIQIDAVGKISLVGQVTTVECPLSIRIKEIQAVGLAWLGQAIKRYLLANGALILNSEFPALQRIGDAMKPVM
jgi:hypothetical protein